MLTPWLPWMSQVTSPPSFADTNELQQNQGDWATADVSGLSTFDHTADEVTTDNASRVDSRADVSGLSTFDHTTDTVANVATVGSVSSAVETDTASRNASKADVSGLSTFDHTADQVVASNMRGTDNALLAATAPTNWAAMEINVDGEITTSNPASWRRICTHSSRRSRP